MLSHFQMRQVRALHGDGSSLFSRLPRDVIDSIDGRSYDPNPDSAIGKALCLAADARKEPVKTLLATLDKNPQLLLRAGNVLTPGGHLVECVTIDDSF